MAQKDMSMRLPAYHSGHTMCILYEVRQLLYLILTVHNLNLVCGISFWPRG